VPTAILLNLKKPFLQGETNPDSDGLMPAALARRIAGFLLYETCLVLRRLSLCQNAAHSFPRKHRRLHPFVRPVYAWFAAP
jgi:hypothetical protein